MQNLTDSQIHFESKTEPSVAKAQNYIFLGGIPYILSEQGYNRGGHRTSKFDHMFILGWGHRTQFQTLAVGRVAGWVAGWVVGIC